MLAVLMSLVAADAAPDLMVDRLEVEGVTRLRVSGITPGTLVQFWGGRPGAGPCPAPLGGACLGIKKPRLLGTDHANASGIARIPFAVPALAPVGTVAGFQATVIADAAVSEVVTLPFAPPSPGPSREALLPGVWTITAAGPPVTPLEDHELGTVFYTFYADHTFALGECRPPIGTWRLDAAEDVVHLDLGFALEWVVLALDARDFVFSEASDHFYTERVDVSCP